MRNALFALSVGALFAVPAVAQASSHREAPFVTKNPKVDGTDFYMFNSYDANDGVASGVVLIANYLPLQDAYGGPNYFTMDDQALYEIEVDNVGDCQEHLTFQFQFTNTLSNGGNGIALNIGPPDGGAMSVAVPLGFIGNPSTASNLNVAESYTVNLVTGNRRTGTSMPVKNHNGGGTTFTKPLDNVGTKTFGEAANSDAAYITYANQFIYAIDIPGCATPGKMFVGQRAEPFAVNLGPTFDLVNAPASVVTAGGVDYGAVANPLDKKNVTTIALDVPAACLNGANNTIVGAWTTASVRQARVYNPKASYPLPTKEGGAWTQVSRLSNPLVNELVIGLPDKDLWNSSEPKDDAQFAKYVTNPTLPALIDVVFGVGLQPMVFPRADLVEAFLTGVPGVNQPMNGKVCEELRLNTALPATAIANQNRLGAALCAPYGMVNPSNPGCDVAGFPNGRRPIDDVVDLALDVVEGYLLPMGSAPAYATGTTLFTDGVDQSAVPFLPTFPFLNTPTRGANGNGT